MRLRLEMSLLVLLSLGVLGCVAAAAEQMFHVSPSGSDSAGDGSTTKPFKTLPFALSRVPSKGGYTVVLLDGNYPSTRLRDHRFESPVVVRAKHRHKAVVKECTLVGVRNLVIEGIAFDGQSNPEPQNVLHLTGGSSYVTLRDLVMTHGDGGYDDSDALKINGGHHILVENCVIFDGTDEEVDILGGGVHDVVFRRNVVYQDKVRKHNACVSVKLRSRRIVFEGNVFANLNPDSANGALRFGGSQKAGDEPTDLLVLNNLFVNTRGRAAMALAGSKRALMAGNIFCDHQGEGVVTLYANYLEGGINNDEFFFVNNVVFHSEGRLGTVYFRRSTNPKTYLISNNLYFNLGRPIPASGFHDPNKEAGAVRADPRFVRPQTPPGAPTLAWWEGFRLRPDSPYLKAQISLDDLPLPESLKAFLADYRHGATDPWYKVIQPPTGVHSATWAQPSE